eukprot:15324239-Ditylum_brightwellii.AAC.2
MADPIMVYKIGGIITTPSTAQISTQSGEAQTTHDITYEEYLSILPTHTQRFLGNLDGKEVKTEYWMHALNT